MAEGSLRVDVNVSLRSREGDDNGDSDGDGDGDGKHRKVGERVEIKNLNSFKSLEKAIAFEQKRQARALDNGESVERETRAFDADTVTTRRLRSKEQLLDYRMVPDPDLPVLSISNETIEAISNEMPELPDQIVARFRREYGLAPREAQLLAMDAYATKYFEEMVHSDGDGDGRAYANWIVNELYGRLKAKELVMAQCPVDSMRLKVLVDLVESNEISGTRSSTITIIITITITITSTNQVKLERRFSNI